MADEVKAYMEGMGFKNEGSIFWNDETQAITMATATFFYNVHRKALTSFRDEVAHLNRHDPKFNRGLANEMPLERIDAYYCGIDDANKQWRQALLTVSRKYNV